MLDKFLVNENRVEAKKSLYAWGAANQGQLGLGSENQPVGLPTLVSALDSANVV
jgi:alpha-tubulin suppressor-like RCC1 family protein